MEKYRKIARWVLAAACVMILFLLAMACLDIHLDGDGFSAESIAARFGIIAPMLIMSAVVGLIAFAYIMSNREKSAGEKSGAELYKAPKEGKKSDKIRGLFLGLALVLIVLGAANGGTRDVLVKAINICTECIGLG